MRGSCRCRFLPGLLSPAPASEPASVLGCRRGVPRSPLEGWRRRPPPPPAPSVARPSEGGEGVGEDRRFVVRRARFWILRIKVRNLKHIKISGGELYFCIIVVILLCRLQSTQSIVIDPPLLPLRDMGTSAFCV